MEADRLVSKWDVTGKQFVRWEKMDWMRVVCAAVNGKSWLGTGSPAALPLTREVRLRRRDLVTWVCCAGTLRAEKTFRGEDARGKADIWMLLALPAAFPTVYPGNEPERAQAVNGSISERGKFHPDIVPWGSLGPLE